MEWKVPLLSREEMGRYMIGVGKETRKWGSLLYTYVLIQEKFVVTFGAHRPSSPLITSKYCWKHTITYSYGHACRLIS